MDIDWKALVKTVAPWIGTALGGPLGGMAVTAIGNAIGIDKPTEDSLKQALSGVTPEQMLALKQADQAFAEAMQAAGFEHIEKLEGLAETDRDSARRREIAIKDKTPQLLAVFVTLGFFGILAFMLTHDVPASNVNVLNIMLGSLGTAWISIVVYYFGSSAGSDKKTDIIAQQAQGVA